MFKVGANCTIGHAIVQFAPTLNIYTGFILSQLMTNTSGYFYSL